MNSYTTRQFRDAYRALPASVQRQARQSYRLFLKNPRHPGLQFKLLDPAEQIHSVRIGLHYRALGTMDGDTITWFWIGSHAGYDQRT